MRAGMLCMVDDHLEDGPSDDDSYFEYGSSQHVSAKNGDIAFIVNVANDRFITILLNNVLIYTNRLYYRALT